MSGAAVVDLCEMGDKLILEETSKVYKKEKEMKKGGDNICTICIFMISRERDYHSVCALPSLSLSLSLSLRNCLPNMSLYKQLHLPLFPLAV